jgi:Protein of unknown function (DUF3619)
MNEQKFAQLITSRLDQSVERLSFKQIHCLSAARRQAITAIPKTEAERVKARQSINFDDGSAALQSGSQWTNWAIHLVPAILFTIGLFFVSHLNHTSEVDELASEASLILTDDVPLAAYADNGFGVFVKNTRSDAGGL